MAIRLPVQLTVLAILLAVVCQSQYGSIQDSIPCTSDSSISYSLYVPSQYDKEMEWPVIFAFDPAARGRIPVELFQRAAEEFGYIVAGSNNAENGPLEPIFYAAELTIQDVMEKFNIDTNCIYTTGFSGGSRVASAIAMITGKMAGVIGCGAGFSPGYPPNFNIEFDYIGIIGNQDFNYQEMEQLKRWLTTFNVYHEMLEYEGGHDWPPEHMIHKAVKWMKIRKMKAHWKYRDYYVLLDFPKDEKAIIKELIEVYKKPYLAYREYQYMVSALKGIKETDQYIEEMNILMADKGFKKEVKDRQRVSEIENMHLKEYKDAFRAYRSYDYEYGVEVKNTKWWQTQVKEAYKYIEKGKTKQDSLLGIRLIDYIWRTAYMSYESVLNTDENILVPIYLEIWSIAKPHIPAPEYLLSRYFIREGDTNEAFRHFENAIDRGFDRWDYFENDTTMVRLRSNRKYRKLGIESVSEDIEEE